MAMTIDTSTPFGERASRRLREEPLAWLITVSPDGQPQPTPVWFEWDGSSILLYSKPDTPKLRNIAANARVTLHLDGNGEGGDIVIVSGTAKLAADPPADQVPSYLEKYRPFIDRNGWTPAEFAGNYSVALRIEPTRLRGW